MLRAVFPNAAFIPNELPEEPSVHTSIKLRSDSLTAEVDALIDSGATDNFISPAVINQFNLPTRILDEPVKV
jgi:hypothetical protein